MPPESPLTTSDVYLEPKELGVVRFLFLTGFFLAIMAGQMRWFQSGIGGRAFPFMVFFFMSGHVALSFLFIGRKAKLELTDREMLLTTQTEAHRIPLEPGNPTIRSLSYKQRRVVIDTTSGERLTLRFKKNHDLARFAVQLKKTASNGAASASQAGSAEGAAVEAARVVKTSTERQTPGMIETEKFGTGLRLLVIGMIVVIGYGVYYFLVK